MANKERNAINKAKRAYAAKHKALLDRVTMATQAPLPAEYVAKCKALWEEYDAKHAPLWIEYNAKHAALRAEYNAKVEALRAEYGVNNIQ